MYKSKYPSLIEFLTNEEDLILLDSEIQNIENLIDKDLKSINYIPCCKSDSEKLNTVEKRNIFNEGYSLGLKTGKRQLENGF